MSFSLSAEKLRPRAALALLSVSACVAAPLSIATAANATEAITATSSSPSGYQQTDAAPPKNGEGAGAEMGQALKQAQQEQRTTLGRYSMAQAVSGVPTNGVPGMDVSSHQPNVDWEANYNKGARFAYIKATEGDYYKSNTFSSQYIGSTEIGMLRGAYHFAIPAESDGATQARYFVANGGGWSADGRTLPGLLDIEYNPYTVYGNTCFNMSATAMTTWIRDFVNTYKGLTGRYPVIYTTTDWWRTCTGNTAEFNKLPLHIANYSGTSGTMPNGWKTYDIWQFSSSGVFAGDSNVYNGTLSDLRSMATSVAYTPKGASASSQTQVFSDVPASHYFYREITWLANTGIATGWTDGTFRPGENITREAMAAFLYRMSGSPAYTAPSVSRFKDVPTTHPFYKEISWLASQGITTGWTDGTFRPGENINRDAMAAFLYRLAGNPASSTSNSFVDVDSDHQFATSITWLANEGVSTGWDDGTFRPESAVTREAMAAFLYRFTHRN